MNRHTLARYTASVIDVMAGISLLAIAAIHLVTGAATAILPLVAAGVLLWAATVLAPLGPKRWDTGSRSVGVLFVETLGFAVVAVTVFVFLGGVA